MNQIAPNPNPEEFWMPTNEEWIELYSPAPAKESTGLVRFGRAGGSISALMALFELTPAEFADEFNRGVYGDQAAFKAGYEVYDSPIRRGTK